MSEVFGIFQIGPVQDFIANAKKTQDLWSGSYLLSFLSCVAMDAIIKQCKEDKKTVIYPCLDEQPLFDYVHSLRKASIGPWEKRPNDRETMPTVPNRFVCKLDAKNAQNILGGAEEPVRNEVASLFQRIKQHQNHKYP